MNALVKVTDIDHTAKEINAAFRAGVADAVKGIIAAGKLLIAAQKEYPEETFKTLVETKLDFSRSTAYRLIAVAEHSVLKSVAHVRHLPPHWGTLAQLARVSDAKLLKAIESGVVHPGMEREDVKALLPKPKAKPRPEPEPEDEDEDEVEDDDNIDDGEVAKGLFLSRCRHIIEMEDYTGPVDRAVVEAAERIALRWTKLTKQLKEKLQ